jgi:hypothetical protein
MKSDFKKRLEQIETAKQDWVADLDDVDYLGLEDYENGEWEELHFDSIITVVRNKTTGEIRGYYNDRRTDEEIIAMGGDLAYL